jgi:hypothetical protein
MTCIVRLRVKKKSNQRLVFSFTTTTTTKKIFSAWIGMAWHSIA